MATSFFVFWFKSDSLFHDYVLNINTFLWFVNGLIMFVRIALQKT